MAELSLDSFVNDDSTSADKSAASVVDTFEATLPLVYYETLSKSTIHNALHQGIAMQPHQYFHRQQRLIAILVVRGVSIVGRNIGTLVHVE